MASSEHVVAATRLLVNYLEAIGKKAGFKWEPDYTAEIEAACEHIVAGALEIGQDLEVRARVENLEGIIAKVIDAAHKIGEEAKRDQAAAFAALHERIEQLEEQTRTPNWRERR